MERSTDFHSAVSEKGHNKTHQFLYLSQNSLGGRMYLRLTTNSPRKQMVLFSLYTMRIVNVIKRIFGSIQSPHLGCTAFLYVTVTDRLLSGLIQGKHNVTEQNYASQTSKAAVTLSETHSQRNFVSIGPLASGHLL